MKDRRVIAVLLAVCSTITFAACSRAFMIVEYPVAPRQVGAKETPAADARVALVSTAAGPREEVPASERAPETETNRYWSAYVHMEVRDLPDLWKANRRDYVLISAKVTLPTQQGRIERDFPLFVIEDGQVQRQQGVDLLQKFPLSKSARDQVVIKIEVRFLDDKEALDTARKILAEVSTAAQPYLGNFAVASKILGSAIPLIDRLAEQDDVPSSSAAFAVEPADLPKHESLLRAYLLFPFATDEDDANTLRTYANDVFECADLDGHLCAGEEAKYATHRVKDVVYLTVKFEPSSDLVDPAILVRGARSDCGMITAGALESAQRYLADNEHLFAFEDVDAAQSGYRLARDYIALREAMAANDIETIIRLAEQELDQANVNTRTVSTLLGKDGQGLAHCWRTAWSRTPAVEAWQVWSLYRTDQSCEPVAEESALRADLLTAGLERVAGIMGRAFDPGSRDSWKGSTSPILQLLQAELATLYTEQRAADFSKSACKEESDARELARSASVYCDECWTELRKACAKHGAALDKIRRSRRALLGPMLEYVREQDDGTLLGATETEPGFRACVQSAAAIGPTAAR